MVPSWIRDNVGKKWWHGWGPGRSLVEGGFPWSTYIHSLRMYDRITDSGFESLRLHGLSRLVRYDFNIWFAYIRQTNVTGMPSIGVQPQCKGEVRPSLCWSSNYNHPDKSWMCRIFHLQQDGYLDFLYILHIGIIRAQRTRLEMSRFWAFRDLSRVSKCQRWTTRLPIIAPSHSDEFSRLSVILPRWLEEYWAHRTDLPGLFVVLKYFANLPQAVCCRMRGKLPKQKSLDGRNRYLGPANH